MAQPSEYPSWATDPGADIVEPSGGQKATGWNPGDRPPSGWWNWAWNLQYEWIKWLDAGKSEIQALSNMRPLRIASAPVAGNLTAVSVNPSGLLCAVGDAALIVGGDRTVVLSGNEVQQRTAGSSYAGDFKSIAWDPVLSAFAAVGTLAEVQTSPTVSAWTRRNTGADTLNAVASNGLGTFVCCGAAGSVYNATALATWTLQTPAYVANNNCVAYGGPTGSKLFVVGSDGGRLQTSLDGITWTEVGIGVTTGNIRRVEWHETHGFIAWESSTIKLLRSPDGVNWTAGVVNHNVVANAMVLLPHHVAFLSGIRCRFWDSWDAAAVSHVVGGLTDLGSINGCVYESTQRMVFAVGSDGADCFVLQSSFI